MKQQQADQITNAIVYGLEAAMQRRDEESVRAHQSVGATMLRGARVVQVGTGGTTRPSTSPGNLIGWSVHNTGVAATQLNLHDGGDAGCPLVAVISLPIGATDHANFGPGGLSLQSGLFVEVAAGGPAEGAVYLRGPE